MFNAAMDDVAAAFNTPWPVAIGVGAAGATGSWDAINAKGTDIASATSINLTTATGPNLTITGTNTVTGVTLGEGNVRFARAAAAFLLTASANLIVNKSASINYTTSADDLLIFIGGAGGVVRVWAVGSALATAGILVRRNRWVNPSAQISTVNGNTLGTTNGYAPADNWNLYFTASTAAMSVQRVQSSRSLVGSVDKIEYKCTTAKVSLGTSDFVTITQQIDGAEFADMQWGSAQAKPLIVSIDVQAPQGLYHVHVQNSAGNRHIAVPLTIASGENNTEVRKQVTIPGDTSGTWLTTRGAIGATIDTVWAAGSTVTGGTLNTWGSTLYYAQATQKNILDANTNVVRLTDVQAIADPSATGAVPTFETPSYDATYDGLAITPWVAYTPTFTGFGTPTGVSMWSRRVGDTLEVRGYFTTGTTTAVEAQITLGFNGVNANVVTDATKVAAIQSAGQVLTSQNTATIYYALMESAVGYMTFGVQVAGGNALTKSLGSAAFANSTKYSVQASFPISSW